MYFNDKHKVNTVVLMQDTRVAIVAPIIPYFGSKNKFITILIQAADSIIRSILIDFFLKYSPAFKMLFNSKKSDPNSIMGEKVEAIRYFFEARIIRRFLETQRTLKPSRRFSEGADWPA